jgi:hypothetical protein
VEGEERRDGLSTAVDQSSTARLPAMTKRLKQRRIVLIAVFASTTLVSLAALAFCQGGPRHYNRKYGLPPARQAILRKPGVFALEKQIEQHTCGFHSVSTVYRAFGIDPTLADLRFRLGTDARAFNFDDMTMGTIHPDMLRVMEQDGLACQLYES